MEIFYTCAADGTGDKLQVYSLILYWSGVSLGLKAGQAASHLPGPWTCGTMHIQTFGVNITNYTPGEMYCHGQQRDHVCYGICWRRYKGAYWICHIIKVPIIIILKAKTQVWDLTSQRAIQSYPQEHSRHGLFKNISQGVAQVKLLALIIIQFHTPFSTR